MDPASPRRTSLQGTVGDSGVLRQHLFGVYVAESSTPPAHEAIELDIHFVREKVAIGELRVTHVPSARQLADVFTKGLPSALFNDLRDSLSVAAPAVETAGGVSGPASTTARARLSLVCMPCNACAALAASRSTEHAPHAACAPGHYGAHAPALSLLAHALEWPRPQIVHYICTHTRSMQLV